MGFFEFIKSAGEALGIGGDDAPEADDIKKAVDKYDLGSENIEVKVDGDRAVITGNVADQSALEKIILAVGNTKGIAGVDAQVSTPDAKDPVFHTVERGDTLSAIAQKHLGSASKYPVIFEANKPMLSHPDKIYPGQVLRIPQD